ncbi:MAG TPA: hypothetical protein VFB04_07295 [Terriglobales bacterium]|nr:hypothetical protein [Terriglobales bacterium]
MANAQSLNPFWTPHLTPLPPPDDGLAPVRNGQQDPSSPWTPLTNQPTFRASVPLLLTDGTVLMQDEGAQDWWRLTPDQNGSYVNGTFTQIASLPAGYSPLYHSSAVLPDGRLIIEGGEYNFGQSVWTDLGAIYDPLANTWTSVDPPPFFGTCCGFGHPTIGDAQSVILFDGTYMQANCCTTDEALLDPVNLTWTRTGSGKFDINDEEGWTLLPNKQVLTVDAYVFAYDPTGTNSEIYVPGSGKWHSAGSTIVQLWDSAAACGGQNDATQEVGPAVLRPDGTVFATGANTCGGGASGHTAIFNSNTATWTAGPDFPPNLNIADGPAALEPNGNVLMVASPGYGARPITVLEWDGANLNTVPGPPRASRDGSYVCNFLVLPTGQILFTDFSRDVEIYTPSGSYAPSWAPRIQSAPSTVSPGGSYSISGHLFNGMSQGAAYGDDVQAATNYPLVRITNNATGHVFYSRTHDHSSMGVAFNGLVSTHFDVPANQETGPSTLVVVANGIPSQSVAVNVQ